MGEHKREHRGKLEENLIGAMRALENQIARHMQRTPAEREEKGVQKWEPYQLKIEETAGIILDSVNEGSIGLDSLLVIVQGTLKALKITLEDLGRENLGDLRSRYCETALEQIETDARLTLLELKGRATLS